MSDRIVASQVEDSGLYRCVASNKLGRTFVEATFTVIGRFLWWINLSKSVNIPVNHVCKIWRELWWFSHIYFVIRVCQRNAQFVNILKCFKFCKNDCIGIYSWLWFNHLLQYLHKRLKIWSTCWCFLHNQGPTRTVVLSEGEVTH